MVQIGLNLDITHCTQKAVRKPCTLKRNKIHKDIRQTRANIDNRVQNGMYLVHLAGFLNFSIPAAITLG